jgi:methionyl-tRNA formyltransferase
MKFTVFISGQKYFAQEILAQCLALDYTVAGVCCPVGDKYIGRLAALNNIPIIPAGSLNADNFPDGVDLGIAAHSHDYIGRATRYGPKYGWIGYHPSLLPRHRGKSSIEWAIRMRDPITGGTVFWLDAGIDRGDILSQEWCFIDPELFGASPSEAARMLWRSNLQEIGIRLLIFAIIDIKSGKANRTKQDPRFSTWEPSTEVKDIYRPDALMLPGNTNDTSAS